MPSLDQIVALFKDGTWASMAAASLAAFAFSYLFWDVPIVKEVLLLAGSVAAIMSIKLAVEKVEDVRAKAKEADRTEQERAKEAIEVLEPRREVLRNLPSAEKDALIVAAAQQVPHVYFPEDQQVPARQNLQSKGIIKYLGIERVTARAELVSCWPAHRYLKIGIEHSYLSLVHGEGSVLLYEGESKPTVAFEDYRRH